MTKQMEFYSPARPTINGRLLYTNGTTVIQSPRIWPTPDGKVEFSVMLPIRGEGPFVSKYFTTVVELESLPAFLKSYVSDPEGTLEKVFADQPIKINFRNQKQTSLTAELALAEELETL